MRQLSILLIGMVNTISVHAFTTDYDQKHFTPIKLKVDKVQNIIDKANMQDPNVYTYNFGRGYGSVKFTPNIPIINNTQMNFVETHGYSYSLHPDKRRTEYSLNSTSINCTRSNIVESIASFTPDGYLFKLESMSTPFTPRTNPLCRFNGPSKFNPQNFSDLRLDTYQVEKLFNERSKDIYSRESSYSGYKEIVFNPYVYPSHNNMNKVIIYSYEYSSIARKIGVYSFKAEQLDCKQKTLLSSALTFDEKGTFKNILVSPPSRFHLPRHRLICEALLYK